MKTYFLALMLVGQVLLADVSAQERLENGISFTPIRHATMVLQTPGKTIYVDPVGDLKAFSGFPHPDLILITDIHGDHLDPAVVNALKQKGTVILGPKAVIQKLKDGMVINNGKTRTFGGITIEAIPMYNLTKERLQYHAKGRGNGYVITAKNKRIYISGDTEDIKEMRALKNIDYAFVCMNIPYTMTVDRAASAVLEMKPKIVYPYHYQGKDGLSDISRFKRNVSKNKDIEVRILDWYK